MLYYLIFQVDKNFLFRKDLLPIFYQIFSLIIYCKRFFLIYKNHLAPVIVISAANFAAAILIESGLSFLGIGAQPPMSSWGAMIKDHYNYIILGKPYLALIPGLCIMSLVMAFMLIGNTLRDALDVKA